MFLTRLGLTEKGPTILIWLRRCSFPFQNNSENLDPSSDGSRFLGLSEDGSRFLGLSEDGSRFLELLVWENLRKLSPKI